MFRPRRLGRSESIPPKAALLEAFSNASDHSSGPTSKKHQSKGKTEVENVCILNAHEKAEDVCALF